ncbi:PREDICTED: eukaryotic translation initiation factor 5B [Nicrophorus vespilloides]|uniref:Eukaryotic translation initiation factor 5B n=1 Tax=Nicrophorus vespilloides TaxID=110193 RepID=A0ABM1NAT8_NICVS|nr:PREDICTED: eukaryotic translation initiation factor 5B [Nicrophorus vespilloides]
MGKAKKGRKGKKGDESESDIDIGNDEVEDNVKTKANKQPDTVDESDKPKKKVNKKKEKKVASDSEDDEEEVKVPVKKVQKGFACLEVDSDSDVSQPPPPEDDSDSEKPVKKNKSKGGNSDERTKEGKKGKKAKRKKNESDDDIEKALAELELEYSGVKVEPKPEEDTPLPEKAKKNKSKETPASEPAEKEQSAEKDDEEIGTGTVKTAAQKKKEKKEREKLKKQAAKKESKKDDSEDKPEVVEDAKVVEETAEPIEEKVDEDDKIDKDSKKKKKKKGAKDEEKDAKDAKKGPGKKTIAAMQEALKKLREEEERALREEEERIKREEEAEEARLEALRLEQERKDKKKKKDKERRERLKAEGKLLTPKQKADRARAQALIDARKAQGIDLPDIGEKKPRASFKKSKFKHQRSEDKEIKNVEPKVEDKPAETEIVEKPVEEPKSDDDVKDTWDAESSEEEESEEVSAPIETVDAKTTAKKDSTQSKKDETSDDSEEDDSDDDDDDDDSDDSEDETDRRNDAEKRRDKAIARIEERKKEAEKTKSVDNLRAAVVCVLGHVDTGKTKILDKLRRTNVQDGEAGGITQQIGATNVPIENIIENIKNVKGASEMTLKIPGLLIIDTPGHESFSNLRSRGSSLCDIAILVVDIMHGLEPQTIESLNLLKNRKTPFIVALNKIDRLYDWQTMNRKDVRDIIKGQAPNTQVEFEQRTNAVIVQFAEQGLNAALFYENPDVRSYVSLVPTSAVTGEGMGNLLALIVESSQNMLAKRLMYSDELQATVLEVKAISGLGTTIDVILINGTLREGDTMLLAGTDGPIVTQIRSLLMPQPMKELRVKNAYIEYKEVKAAQGVKIAAKELEKAIAGLNLFIAHKPDEVDILREEVARELKSALSNIKLQERGVHVQASTLGSLEALLEFLRTSKIPYSGIRIGPVVKKDVTKASAMLEHDSQYATILAFDVKIERDAQELADTSGVKIFQADIIYHLFDKFMSYREELKQKKREEFKHIAVFPCKLKILPQFIFNSRDPIVMGVMIEAGIVKEGTPICVPSKEFVELGFVTSIENNHKNVETARKGMEVCIKIEPIPGESPKMFGRHFDETDMLVSKISRQSIDACKDYFRDDLVKTDWLLMQELKKTFQIL